MESQYLIIAENIVYKNGKLSCLNIYDQFTAIQLPAEFIFDMAVVCGAGWAEGNYNVRVEAKPGDNETLKLGDIAVEIVHENFVYNAVAQNLKLSLGEDVKNISFVIYKNDEIILERNYPVAALIKSKQPTQQPTPQPEKEGCGSCKCSGK